LCSWGYQVQTFVEYYIQNAFSLIVRDILRQNFAASLTRFIVLENKGEAPPT